MLPKTTKSQKKTKANANNKVKDYGNDPFFVEKAERSKAFLEKNGFPKELVVKK